MPSLIARRFGLRRSQLGFGVVAASCIVAAASAGPLLANARHPDLVPTNGHHGMSQQVVACERSGKRLCDPAAARARRFPLSKPDPRRSVKATSKAGAAGTGLLTEQQVLAQLGWSNLPANSVGVSLMTYGQAQNVAPDLAAESSTVVDPSRQVWVGTRYFSTPITAHGVDAPPGGKDTMQVTSASVVIDAATGTVTDSCLNCAAIAATK